MPAINLCFRGWVHGADIQEAVNTKTGNTVSVNRLTSKKLVEKINNGELAISLVEALGNSSNSEVELHDYEPVD